MPVFMSEVVRLAVMGADAAHRSVRRRVTHLALAAFLIAAAGMIPTSASASPRLPLAHSGRWITDATGRVVVLHGTNMVYKISPFYPAAAGFGRGDAEFLRSLGFNAVRVGVLWEAVEPKPGVYNNSYLNRIAATVRTLGRHGVVSLLDFHQDQYNEKFQGEGFPAWAVQDDGLANPRLGFPDNYFLNPAVQRAFENFWANKPGPGGIGLQDRYAAAWAHVARRFRADRSVLGFEIMNEPFPGSDYLTCAAPSGCPASDAELTALNRKVDRAIRSVDSRTLVFYEPYVVFDFGYQDHVGALHDRRAVFAWHDYCLSDEGAGCASHEESMKNAAAHVARTGEGSMMDEFGATSSGSDLDQMVSLADHYMVPWTEWAYCTCDDPTGSSDEGMVLDPFKPKALSNLRTSIVDALVEPYPQVIAGTPQSWGFDRSTHTFRLRYTTRRPSGKGRFRAGSVTEIAVPALVFGRGYSVRAQGGTILSAPGARVLRIASCPRARRLTITVAAGRRRSQSCPPGRVR